MEDTVEWLLFFFALDEDFVLGLMTSDYKQFEVLHAILRKPKKADHGTNQAKS